MIALGVRLVSHRRQAFTLFEVTLSLLLVSFGVISIMMLFPIGIKAEHMARYRLVAAAKAEEMIEAFATTANINPTIEVEAPKTWDVSSGYRPFVPDLEVRVVGHRNGVMPVPLSIARRLESDNNEIQQILNQGGQLFYGQATGSTGLEETGLARDSSTNSTDVITQRLVFAVVGYAQNNNVSFLPQKAWPYWQPYPSPPGHGQKNGYTNIHTNDRPKSPPTPEDPAFEYGGQQFLWEGVASTPTADTPASQGNGTLDTDIRKVFTLGWRPYAYGIPGTLVIEPPLPPLPPLPPKHTIEGAQQYLQVALWYCQKKGIPLATYDPGTISDPVALAEANATAFKTKVADNQKWKYVQAFRFLSHAATCVTKYKKLVDLGGQPSSTGTGFSIPPVTIGPDSLPGITLTHDKIVYYHELCLRQVMLYAASQPYDWGAPRPTQNALFVHYPLIEYDLFTSTSGPISGTTTTARQWKPVTAWPVTNIGRSYSFPNTPIPNGPYIPEPNPGSIWGNPANFTLTQQFEPAERCRQLVFWSVDWMSYEDCETAPGAPVDASRYLLAAPRSGVSNIMNSRMTWCTWCDHHLYAFRNPEKVITFRQSVSGKKTGDDVSGLRILNRDGYDNEWGYLDQGTSSDNKNMFQVNWGADRNFNGKLDRGPVPTSVRMRASAVARYNFYDPRLTLVLR